MMIEGNRIAVFHHELGIGDLIFILPYLESIANKTASKKITLIARPTCRPLDILRGVDFIDEIIIYERGRKNDKIKSHAGIFGFLKFINLLKSKNFDIIIIYSEKIRYGIMAFLSGIGKRYGYGGFGVNYFQRLFLNEGKYIKKPPKGTLAAYHKITDFSILNNFAEKPLTPRLKIPSDLMEKHKSTLNALPEKRVTLAVGASVKHKDWGMENFTSLSNKLLECGFGVVCLGGKAEENILNEIYRKIAPQYKERIRVMMPESVMDSTAIIKYTDVCVGNDTGIIYVAAATESKTLVLIGNRPIPCHDPEIKYITAESVQAITVEDVYLKLIEMIK